MEIYGNRRPWVVDFPVLILDLERDAVDWAAIEMPAVLDEADALHHIEDLGGDLVAFLEHGILRVIELAGGFYGCVVDLGESRHRRFLSVAVLGFFPFR